jgi:hypothetical protein
MITIYGLYSAAAAVASIPPPTFTCEVELKCCHSGQQGAAAAVGATSEAFAAAHAVAVACSIHLVYLMTWGQYTARAPAECSRK